MLMSVLGLAARLTGALCLFLGISSASLADQPPLRIGVLTDASGPFVDSGGPGSLLAAQMAAEDFGGEVLGRKIEILIGDTLNKPDVAGAVARRWFDVEGVSAVTDLPVTPIAFAVQALAKEKNKTVMITAAATTDLTSKYCAINSSHWADDTHAMAGSAKAIVENGGKTWFFLEQDTAFGAALEKAVTGVVEAAGGKSLGGLKHPINTADFSSLLLQAQSSGADRIGLASVGADLDNTIKQAAEFGIGKDGKQSLVAFLFYIQNANALGLQAAKNLNITTSFYWDQNDKSRAFAKRFFEKRQMMPSRNHALIYTAVTHYLEAVKAAGTDEAAAVGKAMRAAPIDYFGHPATMRSDGRVLFDLTLYRVKTPEESKAPWDDYAKLGDVPSAQAFAPVNTAVCGP
jgi:branched-chain amino acid transport system substrate-binding protein